MVLGVIFMVVNSFVISQTQKWGKSKSYFPIDLLISQSIRNAHIDEERREITGNVNLATVPRVKWCSHHLSTSAVPVVSRAFRDANAITLPKDLLRVQRLSMHSRPSAWKNWFKSQGISIAKESGMSFEHFSTLSQACIAGLGVALMPEFLIEPEMERRDLIGSVKTWLTIARKT